MIYEDYTMFVWGLIMPKTCWCKNNILETYSDGYNKCAECLTLVSIKEFDKEIYSVTNEGADLYGSNYWKNEMTEIAGVNSLDELITLHFKDRALYWLKTLIKYVLPPAIVADVGGGLGQFSFLLKKAGFSQIMFEVSPEICEYSQKHLQINVRNEDFAKSKDEKYDSVVLFDLLEHILEPCDFVRILASKTDGIVSLQTPCYDENLTYAEMLEEKPRFANLLIPDQHIFLFSKSSITKLLNENGFSHVMFEPAVFGDDYDMFVFTGKEQIKVNNEADIERALKGNPYLYLFNALEEMRLLGLRGHKELRELQLVAENSLRDKEELSERSKVAEEERSTAIRRLMRKHAQVEGLWESLLRVSELLEINAEIFEVTKEAADARLRDVEILVRDIKILLKDIEILRKDEETLKKEIQRNQRVTSRDRLHIDNLGETIVLSSEILDENHAVVMEYEQVKRQFWFRVLRRLRLVGAHKITIGG